MEIKSCHKEHKNNTVTKKEKKEDKMKCKNKGNFGNKTLLKT